METTSGSVLVDDVGTRGRESNLVLDNVTSDEGLGVIAGVIVMDGEPSVFIVVRVLKVGWVVAASVAREAGSLVDFAGG